MIGKKAAFSLALFAPVALAQQAAYGQCGGSSWTGATTCVAGYTCTYSNDFYSQCVPGSAATTAKTSTTKTSSKTTTSSTKTSSTSSLKTTAAPTTVKTSATTLSTRTTTASSGPVVSTGCTATCTVGYCTLNGGTTGGSGGTSTTVSSLDALTAAVAGDVSKIIYISGTISGDAQVDVGANTHIIGKSGSQLIGIGLRIIKVSNVIVRNVKISKCLAPIDNIIIQQSTNVLIDHADLSSDRQHDKDYYDGLLDMSHAADFITVSNVYFHDHYKGSLIGHSDNNGDQDTGHLRVTEYRNRWYNVNSRGPSLRWGTGHLVNSYYENMSLGYASRDGAQMLVEYNQFVNVTEVDYNESDITGYAVTRGNDFGGGTPTLPVGTLSSVPYSYETIPVTSVNGYTQSNAGQVLSC